MVTWTLSGGGGVGPTHNPAEQIGMVSLGLQDFSGFYCRLVMENPVLFPPGACQACLQSPAVPGRGAHTDGVHHV